MNTGWWEIDIDSCYSLVKIAFAPILACKNNRRIWRHNASTSHSRDVTYQLWWRHNAKSANTVLSDNEEMNESMIVFGGMLCSRHKIARKKKIIHSLPWMTLFWSRVRWFANDFHSWLCLKQGVCNLSLLFWSLDCSRNIIYDCIDGLRNMVR